MSNRLRVQMSGSLSAFTSGFLDDLSRHGRPSLPRTDAADPASRDSGQAPSERRVFPGWRWVAVAVAFPVAVLIGWGVGGRVDAVDAALVGYDTDLGDLAAMGAVSGLVLGAAQGLALAAQGRKRLAVAWATAMPVLLALGWSATTAGGIGVEDQFTVFGAYGAVLFTPLSGLVLARFTRVRAQAA